MAKISKHITITCEASDMMLLIQADKLENALGVAVLRHAEKKPACGATLAAHLAPLQSYQVAVVGDRILTDIVFGNLNGNKTIWTRQIVTEQGDNKMAAKVTSQRWSCCRDAKVWSAVTTLGAQTYRLVGKTKCSAASFEKERLRNAVHY